MTAPMLPTAAPRPLAARRPRTTGAQGLQQGQYQPPGGAAPPAPVPTTPAGAPAMPPRTPPRPPPTGAYAQNPYRPQPAPTPQPAPASYAAYATPVSGSPGGANPYAPSPAAANPYAAPPAPAGAVDNALQRTVLQSLAQPSTYGSADVQRAYGALSGQIDDTFAARNRQIADEMARRGLGVSSEADYRLRDSNAVNKTAHTALADSLLTQQAQTLAQDRVNAAQLAQSYQGQQQQYGLATQQQALASELGRGNLGVAQSQADTQRQGTLGNLALGQQQLTQQGGQFSQSLAADTRNQDLSRALSERLGLGNLGVAQQQAATQQQAVGNQYDLGLRSNTLDYSRLNEDARQFGVTSDLNRTLGLGDLGVRQAGLATQDAQFGASLAEQQRQFGAQDYRQGQSLGLQGTAQQTALMQSAAGILGQIAATPGLSSILAVDPKTGQRTPQGQQLYDLMSTLTSGTFGSGSGVASAPANPYTNPVGWGGSYQSPLGGAFGGAVGIPGTAGTGSGGGAITPTYHPPETAGGTGTVTAHYDGPMVNSTGTPAGGTSSVMDALLRALGQSGAAAPASGTGGTSGATAPAPTGPAPAPSAASPFRFAFDPASYQPAGGGVVGGPAAAHDAAVGSLYGGLASTDGHTWQLPGGGTADYDGWNATGTTADGTEATIPRPFYDGSTRTDGSGRIVNTAGMPVEQQRLYQQMDDWSRATLGKAYGDYGTLTPAQVQQVIQQFTALRSAGA